MPKLELGILRYSNYKAIEISASPTDISGGGTPYYPFFSIKLNVTLKPILPAEGNPINFVLAQMGGYLSLQNNERIADFWTEAIMMITTAVVAYAGKSFGRRKIGTISGHLRGDMMP